jgi:hypothetical protein
MSIARNLMLPIFTTIRKVTAFAAEICFKHDNVGASRADNYIKINNG